MADETEVGVIFPLSGVDTTCEYGRQPPDTAAVGANVRAFEVVSFRSRGGSRCGLTKYVTDQVNGVTSPVQHLTVLVDPEEPSLNGPADTTDVSGSGEYILDPSTNNLLDRNFGRFVRKIGSGRVPNRVKNKHPGAGQYVGTFSEISVGEHVAVGALAIKVGGAYTSVTFPDVDIENGPPVPGGSPAAFSSLVLSQSQYDQIAALHGAPPFDTGFTVTAVPDNSGGFYYKAVLDSIPPP